MIHDLLEIGHKYLVYALRNEDIVSQKKIKEEQVIR